MSAVPTVVVVGAGPAGIAACRLLRDSGARVVLVTPGGTSDYLPGTLPVATGDAPADHYRVPVQLRGVEVVPAAAEAIEQGGVRVEGSVVRADAVVGAPGLALERADHPATGSPTVCFWDPSGAKEAAPAILGVERGTLDVVITSLPYRCPPAPYGLAMRLAERARRLGNAVSVRLFTPEPHPLAALGRTVGDRLLETCARAGVEVHLSATPRDRDHQEEAVLQVVVPRHRATPLLAELTEGESLLVPVDGDFATAVPGVFVAGDAAKSPYPRAAGPAAWSGARAAASALAYLGLDPTGARDPHPMADCLVDEGGGAYERIQVTYPAGPPPEGTPQVAVDDLSLAGQGAFDLAREVWRASCKEA